ncbi:MAG: hypothetical protein RBR15_15965 [Sphaerochaeta sp.]|nr:hypothetical protein [Sphaerochaeta sp.]
MNTRKVENKNLLLDRISRELDSNEEAQYYTRVVIVRLALAGLPVEELATLSGKSVASINLWIRLFLESGSEGLELHQGKHPKLSLLLLKQIKYDLNCAPSAFGYSKSSWTGALLSEHIALMYTMKLHPRQCQRILAEHKEQAKRE